MPRLIDADALWDKVLEHVKDGDVIYRIPPDFIDKAPTVDAVYVRHGRWIGSGENVYCSECRNHPLKYMDKDVVYYWRYQPNYCPNCGAKMDLIDK